MAVIQFLWLPAEETGLHLEHRQRNNSPLASKTVCANSNIFSEPAAFSPASRMSLLEEARRVAAEFDYPPDEVNKGVKEFIRQMGWFSNIV